MSMNESYIISKYLKPLSKNFRDSINLSDDAAILKLSVNKNLVVSVDNFIYGVHCPKFTNISNAMTRAILTAVSDLSAMAAKPYCIFIAININNKLKLNIFKDIQKGIRRALRITKTELAGGDICSSNGPISFSVTVVGQGNKKFLLKRSGAKSKQLLCVTGNIGDAKIGLDMMLKKKKNNSNLLENFFVKKFLTPPFRNNIARDISKYVSSCIDISDGLLSDVSKLAKNSNCGLKIFFKNIPFSLKAKQMLKDKSISASNLINAGDDYELAFSVSINNLKKVESIAKKNKTKISVIGVFTEENKILLDNKIFSGGYSHF